MNTITSPIKLNGARSKSKTKNILQDLTKSFKSDNDDLSASRQNQ